MLRGGDSPVISWPWWLNMGGSRLEQYFTVLEVAAPPELHAIATESSESVRESCFPKPSCYLSDFLIRLDLWLHCTAFGRNSAGLKSCTCELFMCTVQGHKFQVTFVYVWLLFTSRSPDCHSADVQALKCLPFFYISSGSVCFWHTLQHAGPCVLFAIQLWSVLNCRGSKLHKEGSYLCNITQSADSTDFKEHLKRRQERDSVEIVFKVVTFSKASVM